MRGVIFAAITISASLQAAYAAPDADAYGTGAIQIVDHAPAVKGHTNGRSNGTMFSYRFVDLVDGVLCWRSTYTSDESEARAFRIVYDEEVVRSGGLSELRNCPAEAAPTPQQPSPGELARDFWDVRHLPSPTLRVVPDDAVVGKRVYLQILGPARTTFDVPNPIGADIDITATSTYVVDWGDGTPPTTTTSQGGPWPDGDVTHVYDTAHPARTINVTQQWSATWRAGPGVTGRLDNLHTGGRLAVRVDQLQPVRNR